METFLGSLGFGIVAALAWIAYHHPVGYKRIAGVGLVVIFVTAVGLGIWGTAISNAYVALVPQIKDTQAAHAAIDGLTPPFGPTALILGGSAVYILLLSALHEILRIEKKEGDSHQ